MMYYLNLGCDFLSYLRIVCHDKKGFLNNFSDILWCHSSWVVFNAQNNIKFCCNLFILISEVNYQRYCQHNVGIAGMIYSWDDSWDLSHAT